MSAYENVIKPRAVRAGATLGIVSPASAAKPELVAMGVEALERLGYRTKVFPHALARGPLYYAGRLEDRLQDLHTAFADDDVDAILCTRGGWGSAELLPFLDRELIRAHPKAFLGYSDHTSLHLWLRNEANLVSFQAPMVAADFAREGGVDLESWRHALSGQEGWTLGAEAGLRVLRPGVAEGELSGGCIAIYAEAIGTPYGARAVGARGRILFLEDIGTKPYQWDRMLLHLRYAGLLDSAHGIVFGDMTQCVAAAEVEFLERAILHSLREFKGPIAIGLRCGHVSAPNITLPLNVRVRLDLSNADKPQMQFLETAVAV